MNPYSKTLSSLLVAFALSGCATLNPPKPGDSAEYRPVAPLEPRPASANNGAIFQPALGAALFEDRKALRVGDLVTVMLNEKTNAKKSSATSTAKDSNATMDVGNVTIAGRTVLAADAQLLGLSSKAGRTFDGSGDSSQSNQFSGEITVTVAEVLPNGNLVIQGEKWLGINQGNEFVRLRGIVRPVDITKDNKVNSTQIANAQLYYGGTGALQDSNAQGWLTRFFNSPILPI
ncbi:flagellar basal body L-ring protein FlgH [Allochromatium vinosum]|uniref:Flagellar L-ring protein n=1 Tax=Allochromatium vinosum (strain ATCC 17899 / DSM 180 / NBRC 103801 / NCIMB 10441 / D) TaxID=572477 RepID=D3RPN8_ALLVD|nr:flagellar basal body L-ring protein FlgH [Allochromatium vinosum]ADC61620.1 flagellar L-ring protein [Allochromatium vinosum DSM 180]